MNILNYYKEGIIFILTSPIKIIKYLLIGIAHLIGFIPKYILTGLKYIFERKKPQEDILENKFISIIITTLTITTYLLCVFILSRWYVQNERTKKFANSLNTPITNETEESTNQYKDLTNPIINNNSKENIINDNFMNVDLNYYISKNKETVAWIQVNGTNISYPVVKHKDNSYYLNHDFYNHKTNVGWIFGDYRDDFEVFTNNTIIYGHNLVNRTMFGQIPYMLRKKWFSNKNKEYIKMSTKNTNSIWQIFSVYEIKPTTDYLQATFNSTITYQEFLNMISKRSIHKFNTELNYTDKIITLSTCNDIGNKRVVVHAKLIKIENK